jgi:hypothetical protein
MRDAARAIGESVAARLWDGRSGSTSPGYQRSHSAEPPRAATGAGEWRHGVGDGCAGVSANQSTCSTGSPGSEPGERLAIEEIILDASGNCGAGHVYLIWAPNVDPAGPVAASGAGCQVVGRDDEVAPVPPLLAPGRPSVDRVCICRCDGGAAGTACDCPGGMSCRELIQSSGANGAAAEYVGSYCLY